MLRTLVPQRIRRLVRQTVHDARVRRACRALRRAEGDGKLAAPVLERTRAAWGNEGFAAPVEYLTAMASLARAERAGILECGSGVTTLVLGVIAEASGVPVCTLEHDESWCAVMERALRREGLDAVRLIFAPLRSYGEFAWYDVMPAAVPAGSGLVVCDGPPRFTPGGRRGVLSVIGSRLRPGAVLLVDDATRANEVEMLEDWRRADRVTYEVFGDPRHAYAVARLRQEAREQGTTPAV